ncbi:ABC transporter substrate-binding protein [Aciditerrimonas ferrireducens]|jgi:peptide/nickel transport system substrate-binding protein|uniref:ABC transporter substrate-binding protein n=1 Tax=Aciditerrimonas ferrireducens TaxID=667306 RepID=UPI002003396D|nr:ABC transporter substrate-binding protein [Aciditerrimonas ferrireducens]MCK4177839.1 ABC transporter substrate-binding protein [Aciditerrimonas ferrireducens]
MRTIRGGTPSRRMRRALGGVGVLCVGALTLASCSSSSSSAAAPTKASAIPSGGTKLTGGTVVWAEPPSATPNYIFPFDTSQYSTVDNISQFQYLLYRPLYMFGSPQSTSPTVDPALSLADLPVFSKNDSVATITLKHYMWSNGEQVTANDVLFWMNMLHAEKNNWYDYVPGYFPDNVTSVTVDSPTQLTITFNRSYNPTWLLYNELSQITPMPKAWDVTSLGGAPGSGGCSTGTYGAASTDSACTAVYNFLANQAKNLAGYASSPIWSVVDGPFKLASFSTSGQVVMVPNPDYSGPQKPIISKFEEVPFTTEDAEYNALLGGDLTVGYLPTTDLTASTSNPLEPGPNNPRLAGKYYMDPWVLFGFNYAVLKFESTGDHGAAGAIFKQLYIRQAMQSLVDQTAMISKLLKGYGVPSYGPVPVLPPNSFVDSYEKSNPYPYDPAKAKALLADHGWKVVPNGTDTCVKPGTGSGECGAGIPAGTPLSFTFAYATGVTWIQQTATIEQSAWKSVGINVTLAPGTFNTVVGDYSPPCTSPSSCSLEMGWWGGGWEYSPDYYPSGETLFLTGAGSNSGNYSSPEADKLIEQTVQTTTNLDQYQNYLAQQLPVIYEPNADYSLTEVAENLRGVVPQNPFSNLFPEYWYFVKK